MNKVIEIIVMLVLFLTAQPANIFTTRRDPATTLTEFL